MLQGEVRRTQSWGSRLVVRHSLGCGDGVRRLLQYRTYYDVNDTQLARNDISYCVNLVRERDFDQGYICGLLLPKEARNSYFAMRALNVELASIKDTSAMRLRLSQTDVDALPTPPPPSILALQLRMQWWRNAIVAIFDSDLRASKGRNMIINDRTTDRNDNLKQSISEKQPHEFLESFVQDVSTSCWKNPIVRALDRSNRQVQFTKWLLERIIDVREMDLQVHQYPTTADCCNYAEETISTLLMLSLECTNVQNQNAETPATLDNPLIMDLITTSAGVGIGLSNLLRATPYRLLATSSIYDNPTNTNTTADIPLPADLFRPEYPYQQIVNTFMKREDDTQGVNALNIDPAIQSKMQRHMPNAQLSSEDVEMFYNAIHSIVQIANEQLLYVRDAQGQIPKHGRMCFLPIIPAMHFLYKLQHVHKYNVFDLATAEQSKSSAFARDRIRVLLQLGRTWLTGIF
jgi:NADH dehydrogenase [ubiquinone] 1 alpha subcomplex assembly factor 6